jgi:alpha-galactosidase
MGEVEPGLVWQAHGTAEDMILLVTRTQPSSLRYPPQVRLPMALAGRSYIVSRDAAPDMRCDGGWLAHMGLPLPEMRGEEVLIFRIAAV